MTASASTLRELRSRGRARGTVALLGPAFVAAVAYVDPGNFGTNLAAAAASGYALAWAIVIANLMAMLVQYLSAKIGVATGRDLPELCRDHLPVAVSRGLWVQAELIAMATDLAEFVGAAVGLNLLFGVPLLAAGLITAVVAFAVLALDQRGYRRFELAIGALLAIVFLGFAYDQVAVGTQPGAIAAGLVPSLGSSDGLLLVAGIIGATVMPHVVYLHSALTKDRVDCRDDGERREVMRYQRLDVLFALGAAGIINLAMLAVAASLFRRTGADPSDSIMAAHAGLARLVGGGAALAFAVALLASGLSASSVGTYAGQVVMEGFIGRSIPLFTRRAVTMLPALVVLGLGLPV
ncbi:MAG: Nramp family divalent metal transporter, partial [Streptosporangiaceae bacterium]